MPRKRIDSDIGPSIARTPHLRVAKNPHDTSVTFRFHARPKVVFTTTVQDSDWRPLQRAFEREAASDIAASYESFRFIGHAAGPDDIGSLHVYRHRATRRYLVLDATGRAYRFDPRARCYGYVDLSEALERVLGG